MDIEKSPPEIAKKLWKVLKIVMKMMMRKSICKRKTMVEAMQMLVRRGKIAGTAIAKAAVKLHHHDGYYSAITCRSDDPNTAFFSPRDYEFSCSNTPIYHSKRRNNRRGVEEVRIMSKVFDILNRYDAMDMSPLPGFGGSPVVRVTDSPFPVREAEEKEGQVDEDAEEFIRKFYKDLRKQKRIAALDSPSPYHYR